MGKKRFSDDRLFSDCVIGMMDVETTGLDPLEDRVTEIALTAMDPTGMVVASCSWLVNPGREIPAEVVELTGITNEMVVDAPTFGQIAGGLVDVFPKEAIGAAYNARFDRAFMIAEWARCGHPTPDFLRAESEWVDPMIWARVHDPYAKGKGRYKLVNVAARMNVVPKTAHRALADTETAALVLREMQPFRVNGRAFVFPEEPTVSKFLLQQRIFQAKQEADFFGWLIKQPPMIEVGGD